MRKVFAGIKATRQLLRGAKPIISPRKGRSDYVKQGDYGTAVGDFFALRPTDIKDIKHADVCIFVCFSVFKFNDAPTLTCHYR